MTSHAFLQATGLGTVCGPLTGHHREWYVVRSGDELAGMDWLKVGEPREGVVWFDRRFFASEEELLLRLPAHGVPRVPPVRRLGSPGPVIHGFIAGDPLNELAPAGSPVAPPVVDQIMAVFGALARVTADDVAAWGIGTGPGGGELPDGGRFLEELITFTREGVHERMGPEFGELFEQFGVPADALGPQSRLVSEAARLTRRPFCLLHGDLHRANFIVDAAGRLWTIDWELAAVGDPLYDLATHLHLMRYPADQERAVTEQWRATVGEAAAAGSDDDLPRYLAYKRIQSVYTDVIRHAIKIRGCATAEEREAQLHHTAKAVEDVLVRAGECMGLESVPGAGVVERVYGDFCRAD